MPPSDGDPPPDPPFLPPVPVFNDSASDIEVGVSDAGSDVASEIGAA